MGEFLPSQPEHVKDTIFNVAFEFLDTRLVMLTNISRLRLHNQINRHADSRGFGWAPSYRDRYEGDRLVWCLNLTTSRPAAHAMRQPIFELACCETIAWLNDEEIPDVEFLYAGIQASKDNEEDLFEHMTLEAEIFRQQLDRLSTADPHDFS